MPKAGNGADLPAYQQIKGHIVDQIQTGLLKEGDLIPSEEALVRQFGVSRMTVNRAMRELSDERIVVRRRGSGTYVSEQKHKATIIELKNIADEIAARGHRHRSELQLLERIKASETLARKFNLPAQATLFHSIVLHLENDKPIQLEDRYVNPAIAPDYMSQDFTSVTPTAYLIRVAPLQEVRYAIEADSVPERFSELLQMSKIEPCLVMRRTTRSRNQIATVVTLWHPASRYQLTGGF